MFGANPSSAIECASAPRSISEEVDAVMRQTLAGGADILKPAQKTFWGGYAGYFQDPDGHMWEVAWNPAFLPED